MKRKLSLIYPFLIFILMALIFHLSSQIAVESDVTSSRFCRFAARHLFSGFDGMSKEMQWQITEGLSFIIRKTAHFCEYALMGALWYLWLYRIRFAPLISFGATALYACTDEFHQLFVQGRSGELRDVLVDSAGGAAGVLAAFILLCILYCIRRKQIVHWGTWEEEI